MAKSRSTSRIGLLALLLAALVSGCDSATGGDASADLVLGDQVGLQEAKAAAAGSLTGTRFRFEWANFPGAAPLFEALNAGAVDTAPAGDAPAVLAAAADIPIRIVAAAQTAAEGVAILVPKDSPIGSVAELKGHRVIVSSARGSVAHYLLLKAIEEAGLTPAEVDIGFMLPSDAASAFAAGRMKAWATFGTYQATAERRGARILRDGRGINTGIAVITASTQALQNPRKRQALADYLARQARANEWSRAHPNDYAALYAKRTGVPIEVAATIVRRENPALLPPDRHIVEELQRVADDFYRYKVIPKPVRIAPLVDPTLFPQQRQI